MSVFDLPKEDVTREESSASPSPDEGSEPRGNQSESRVEQLERELSEMRSVVTTLMAKNAAAPAAEEPKVFPVEELKAFAERDGGKYQFDAAKAYTDQEMRNFRKQQSEEFQAQIKRQAVEDEFYTIVPELRDPNSAVSKAAEAAMRDIKTRRPGIDDGMARELAILKAAKEVKGQPVPTRFNPARAAAASPGIGAPTGGAPDRGEEITVTEGDIETLRRMGSQFVDDPDPKKRQAALDALKRNKENFRRRAMVTMGGMFGGTE